MIGRPCLGSLLGGDMCSGQGVVDFSSGELNRV